MRTQLLLITGRLLVACPGAGLKAQDPAPQPVVLEGRGVLRSHQRVIVPGEGDGEVTSGTFSPTLERSIGLARVPAATGERVEIEIRDKRLPARIVKPPFVRHGQICIDP